MRALLVDDDDLLRRALTRSLGGVGIQVDEARGVHAALEALRRIPYDVVVSDEEMRDGHGPDLLAEVSRLRPDCRRVLMSGRNAPVGHVATWERFFAKPYEMHSLIRWLTDLAEIPRPVTGLGRPHARTR